MLGLVVVLAGALAAWNYIESSHRELVSSIEALRLDLRREQFERQRAEDQVQRMVDLYSLVGAQLSEQGEDFSEVLQRSLVRRDEALGEIRSSLQALAERLEEVRRLTEHSDAARREFEEQVTAALEAVGGNVEAQHRRLEGLETSLEQLSRQLLDQEAKADRRLSELRRELEEHLSSLAARLQEMEQGARENLAWAQSEVGRLDRRIDDLSHRLSRLESQRRDE
ncbi:MAG: hypothetical protein Kow00109_16650 [Acidobacteriota bacterium]